MTMFHININMNRSISAIIHHRLTVLMLLSFMILSVGDVQAQPGGLDDDPGESVPLDGGISLLLGAGVYFGTRRMNQRNRKRSVQVKTRPMP